MLETSSRTPVHFPSLLQLAAKRRNTLMALGLGIVAALSWWHAAGPQAGAGYDYFSAYYAAAHAVATGHSPYQQLAQLTAAAGSSDVHGRGYVYPPLLAVLLSFPLRLGFTARASWLLWILLNVVAVGWIGYELNVNLRGSRSWSGTLAFAAAVLLPAVVLYDLWLGQADLLMAALALGSYGLWLRGHRWAAAIALGTAIAIKPTVALILLVWLWKGDWGVVLRGIIAAAVLVLLPCAFIGLHATQEYVTFFVHWNAFSANADFINQAPYALLLRLFTQNGATPPLFVAPWLVSPLRVLLTLGAVLLWLRATPRSRENRSLEMCAGLLVLPLILLLSPLAEDIHFTLLAPALVGLSWLAWVGRTQRSGWTKVAGWALWVALLVSYLPRMQELIYPTHLFVFPGQNDVHLGPIITLLRTSILLWLAVVTLVAGQAIVRASRITMTSYEPVLAVVPQPDQMVQDSVLRD